MTSQTGNISRGPSSLRLYRRGLRAQNFVT